MKHLNVRCPSCAKLYQVDVAAIFSTSPHFQCVSCSCRFSFDFPPVDPEKVEARALEEVGAASVVATRKCPRCGSESPKTAEECYSCHVIFEKLEGLPSDPALKTQPSLVRRWKELLEDYGNEDKHHEFLMACRDLDALNFARHKYEHIRQMQGQDELATAMLLRLDAFKKVEAAPAQTSERSSERNLESRPEMKIRSKPSVEISVPAASTKKEQPPKWMRFVLMAPFVISFLLILWGVAHTSQRNMIGTGIAIGLLSYGLITGLRGPLRIKDFLN